LDAETIRPSSRSSSPQYVLLFQGAEKHLIVFVQNLTLLLVIITSAIHLWLLVHRKFVPNFQSALQKAPGSAAAFCLSVVVIGPVAALFFYHVRLMLLNITTIEQVRNQAHRSIIPGPLPPNAFTLGKWYRNLAYLMCRPITYSWVEADAYVMHDQRLPNPGYGMSWKDEDLEISTAHRSAARNSGTWQDSQHY
jgi:palmitoyltransferase ZDHHC9/14/18